MNLIKADWDDVEALIENALMERIRVYDSYKYMIVNDHQLLVKVYDGNQLIFTIKFQLNGDKLDVAEAW